MIKPDFSRESAKVYWRASFNALDQAMNIWLGPLLNLLLNKDSGIRFGADGSVHAKDRTISGVLGMLILIEKSKGAAWICKWILSRLLQEENHCVNSIDHAEWSGYGGYQDKAKKILDTESKKKK